MGWSRRRRAARPRLLTAGFSYLQNGDAGGGAQSNSGGAAASNGGTTSTSGAAAVEADPERPVLNCGGEACADGAMIIDMESNDGLVCASDGRSGSVSYFGDGTGSAWPPAGAATKFSPLDACRGSSAVALHTKGANFKSWGAGISVLFSSTGFDASLFSGIVFWAKSSTSTQISIGVATPATQDVAYGGDCKPSSGKQCNDHFATKRTLSPGWMAYPISFAELSQVGWGVAAPTLNIDRTALLELNIVAPAGQPFDYWLDDITFTP
ncbi:MAG: hypothetical protein QM756_09260 [Polyangiaceae bacterium]